MVVTISVISHDPPMDMRRYLEDPIREDLVEKMVLPALLGWGNRRLRAI